MIERLFKLTDYIPKYTYYTIFDIPFIDLYKSGKRSIFFDIDNTIMSYDIDIPPTDVVNLFNEIKRIGFEIIIVSNNHKERVKLISDYLNVPYFYETLKPFKYGFKKALKHTKYNKEEVITIGDQLMTDILGSNRMGLDSILVHCIKRSTEKWYTRLNRIREKNILKRLEKKYSDDYKKIIEVRGID